MKIRMGLVSNSSSSSFIVAFPKKPSSADEVKHILFGEQKTLMHYDHSSTTEKIAETVFSDMKKSASKRRMYESIRHGWFHGYKDLPGMFDNFEKRLNLKVDSKEYKKAWEEDTKENNKRAKAILDRFMSENPDSQFYVFEYGDHDGEYFGLLEHGEIFDKLPHIQTSYH